MSSLWFYRTLGQDFGPVPFEELKSLADDGIISKEDEVRCEDSRDWKPAASVQELIAKSAPTSSVIEPQNEWYCSFLGHELGPLTFDEVIDYVERGQLGASDQVKHQESGKWRRVDSIGRLATILTVQTTLPAKPVSKTPERTGTTSAASPQPKSSPATPVAKPSVPAPQAPPASPPPKSAPVVATPPEPAIDVELIKAQVAQEATERTARHLIRLSLSPMGDAVWWGLIDGVPYGPVDVMQILTWAVTGYLKPTDYVRNGYLGQYLPVTTVPGLLDAAGMIRSTTVTLQTLLAKSAPVAVPEKVVVDAAVATPAPSATPPKPEVEVAKPAEAKPAPSPATPSTTEAAPTTPAEPRPSGDYSTPSRSYGSFPSTPARSTSIPKKAAAHSSKPSPLSMVFDFLKTPAGKGALAAVLVVTLGWTYYANRNNTDIKRYQTLRRILDDVRAKRFVKSSDVAAIKDRAAKVKAELSPALKREAAGGSPLKKSLAAAVEELPKMMEQNLAQESNSEKEYVKRLNEAKKILGLK